MIFIQNYRLLLGIDLIWSQFITLLIWCYSVLSKHLFRNSAYALGSLGGLLSLFAFGIKTMLVSQNREFDLLKKSCLELFEHSLKVRENSCEAILSPCLGKSLISFHTSVVIQIFLLLLGQFLELQVFFCPPQGYI